MLKPNLLLSHLVRFGMMGIIKLNLSRGASVAMRHEKSQLIAILHSLSFSLERDSALWLWEPNGLYSIKSMYHFLCFGGLKRICPIRFGY
jgi:hypothetical protein